jgi:fructosamine-3-kinase
MWHGIAGQISAALGQRYQILTHEALSVAPEERLFRISDGQQPLFIKLAPRNQLDRMAVGIRNLASLRLYDKVCFPTPICCGTAGEHCFMALEFLELHDAEASPQWFSLGAALARLHRSDEQAMYGWDEDNYLDTTVQPNRWQKQWSSFFAEQRIGWQLQLLREQHKLDLDIDIEGVIDTVRRLLSHHNPKPSPLHGDLWRGNCGFTQQQSVLFSPASYFGDRETDLAMTELFGRFPDTFYAGYQSIWPLEPGYAQRRDLYNLYHQLNHYQVSGDSYRNAAIAALTQLLAT